MTGVGWPATAEAGRVDGVGWPGGEVIDLTGGRAPEIQINREASELTLALTSDSASAEPAGASMRNEGNEPGGRLSSNSPPPAGDTPGRRIGEGSRTPSASPLTVDLRQEVAAQVVVSRETTSRPEVLAKDSKAVAWWSALVDEPGGWDGGTRQAEPEAVGASSTQAPADGSGDSHGDRTVAIGAAEHPSSDKAAAPPADRVASDGQPHPVIMNDADALPEMADDSSVTRQTAEPGVAEQTQDRSAVMPEHVSVPAEAGQPPTLLKVDRHHWQPPGAPLAAVATPVDDEARRLSLAQSLPSVDPSTPLAAEVAEDARRRISMAGRSFPRPPRTRILTVANQKGGVGKTTTTVNVAAALAQAGLNVLVLDIDPQGNASTALGIDHHADVPSLYDVVIEDRPLAEVLQPCPDVENLWCAPATIDLAGAEIELVSLVAREVRLKKALETYLQSRAAEGLEPIDYVFIDCPPSLSLLTINAFVAANEVFIPIQCEYYALEGLSQLLKHVELIRGHLNPELHVSTILLTMYDGRTRLSSQVADEVRGHFPNQVVRTAVPRSVRISEAPSHGQTVMTYDPASSGALSYLEAARELAEQILTWGSTTNEERA